MPKSKQTAFSLVELSIVILIIGILIAGVTQLSGLVNLSKVSSAKSLTKASVVSGITELSLWLETTSDNSFLTNETDDNISLSTWKDINPQTNTPNNLTKTANTMAVYKTTGINNLPSVYFNGTASTDNAFSGSLIYTKSNNYTLFAVYTTEDKSSATWRPIIINGNGSSGWRFQKSGVTNKRCATLLTVVDSCTSSTITINPEIISVTYDGTTDVMYLNGTLQTLTAPTGSIVTPVGRVSVGGYSSGGWKGFIGEIIVYGKVLKSSDRKEVEKYLSKKWGVTVDN
ncbi:MAG: prepilin-type N-terminal cleavage/methylation domain-containing protein [Rickettsiales bacterium]|nr:prepilin-type N-terminal cleavage/methylation domain-containing protein [Rickettsiales bacterium]